MGDDGIPRIDPAACTACGDCVRACPKELLALHPVDRHLLVQCRSLLAGDEALDLCRVACNACGRIGSILRGGEARRERHCKREGPACRSAHDAMGVQLSSQV